MTHAAAGTFTMANNQLKSVKNPTTIIVCATIFGRTHCN